MNRAPLLSTGVALVLGVAIAGIVACGGSMQKTAAQRPQADGGMPAGVSHDPRIVDLDAKITAEFAKLGAGERQPAPPNACTGPQCAEAMSMKVKPAEDTTCKPGPSTTCKDTCTFADSICDNAKKICDIANELGNDAWANTKCADGETSCNTAHDRCCGCL